MSLFVVLGFIVYIINGGERVKLYDEWIDQVEHISSYDALLSLVPKKGNEFGAENNIILYIYEDTCIEGINNPVFEGAMYQTGPGVIHLATLNKKVYPDIINEWDLVNNCSQYIWIYAGQYYDDYKLFSKCPDSNVIPFTNWIKQASHISVPFIVNHPNNVEFYWYERDEHHLGTLKPDDKREESTFVGHIFMARDAVEKYLIDIYLVKGSKPFIISSMNI